MGLALLLSPLAATLPIFVFAIAEAFVFPQLKYGFYTWQFIALVATAIAYTTTFLIGLPIHLILCRINRATVSNHVLAGVIIALVPSGAVLSGGTIGDDAMYPLLFIVCSAAVSWVFGLTTATFYRRS